MIAQAVGFPAVFLGQTRLTPAVPRSHVTPTSTSAFIGKEDLESYFCLYIAGSNALTNNNVFSYSTRTAYDSSTPLQPFDQPTRQHDVHHQGPHRQDDRHSRSECFLFDVSQ
jgi:hypothetical protein